MTIRALVLLSASLVPSGIAPALAQSKPVAAARTAAPAKPDYSRESSVVDHLDRVYRYAADGTGAREITAVIEVRDQASVKTLSVLSFGFASSSEKFQLDYMRVRHADGMVVPTPSTDVQEQPSAVTREAPFYSDLKEVQIPVRSLREGDVLEYHLIFQRTRAEAPGHFWGSDNFVTVGDGLVTLSETVELHVPTGVYVNTWSPKYMPNVTEAAPAEGHTAETIYRWQTAQLQPVAGKTRNELLRMENDPTLGTSIDPRPSQIQWTNFHSWAEVGAWYRSLEGARTTPDDEVRARVASLIEGKSTPDEKARAIYGFVAPQVRYIGVAFGIGRYQPHEAADVLRNQYGDCKDKTTLLSAMLSAAGITSDAALIGIGVAFTPEVPSPAAFNHAINLAHVDGKPVWLDSTAEVAPYNLLIYAIRKKQALVIPLTGDAHIETTPADPPFAIEQRFDAKGTLDSLGTSHSRITIDLRGDDELAFRQAIRATSPAQYDQLMQQVSQAMSFSGKVTNATFSRPDDTTTAFHVTYDYEREKAGDWDNLRILPQLPPIGVADADEKDPPVRAIELGQLHAEISHAVMQLPRGWRAELPAAIHAKAAFATYDKTYTFENGVLTTDRKLVILAPFVPAAEWKVYHRWYKDAGLEGENYVQLDKGTSVQESFTFRSAPKPGGGSSTELTFSGKEDNPAAAQLVIDAMKLMQSNEWDAAKSKLDQARTLNPKDSRLQSAYAILTARDKRLSDTTAAMQHAIDENPNEPRRYRSLADFQRKNGRIEDAIVTMRSAVEHNPADESSVLYLASIYMQGGDSHAAVAALRAGLASLPDDAQIRMRLGIALLHDGKAEEGVAILKAVLDASDDPNQLNSAAYALAEASLELPLAESAARHCIELLDIATNNGETGNAALRRTNLLVSAWDTLGWILFREDKPTEAEPLIRAAWRNGSEAETGYHLALVLEKLNQTGEVLPLLRLASVGGAGTNGTAVKKLIDAKLADLHAANYAADLKAATLKLQEQRTYKLPQGGTTATGAGWATVELEVDAQGVKAFRILDGDTSLQPLATTIQQMAPPLLLPPSSNARLLRHGVLSCHSGAECELVLLTTVDALNPS